RSVSITFGGVPRVCRGPSITWTTPAGGTRTSTALPGTRWPSSSSVYRTAVRCSAGLAPPWRHAARAASPASGAIRRRATRTLPGSDRGDRGPRGRVLLGGGLHGLSDLGVQALVEHAGDDVRGVQLVRGDHLGQRMRRG